MENYAEIYYLMMKIILLSNEKQTKSEEANKVIINCKHCMELPDCLSINI
jgi:hypothetical protein